MLLIPSMELKNRRCVHTPPPGQRDRRKKVDVIYEDPIEIVDNWYAAGTRAIHIVDVNSIGTGEPENIRIIEEIKQHYPEMMLQVSGGINNEDSIMIWLDAGAQNVVIGNKAVKQPRFVGEACAEFPGHIMVAIDARKGRINLNGKPVLDSFYAVDLAKRFADDGVEGIIFTDISQQGHVGHYNLSSSGKLADKVDTPIIANGGIATLDDVKFVCRKALSKIRGVIVGRPIYDGKLDLAKAHKLMPA